ncbi:hypothetical protein [Paenalcaligenes niemegkensis]|uniref:hypothetical protein n=1 Tax=Paenalcaligenes niemegkensis TaxID=2895469 RepID=UPI003566C150
MKLISEAKTTQRQSLSLTMRNSVQLLNLPLLECAELVQSTLQTNPFLVSDTDNEDIDAPTPLYLLLFEYGWRALITMKIPNCFQMVQSSLKRHSSRALKRDWRQSWRR